MRAGVRVIHLLPPWYKPSHKTLGIFSVSLLLFTPPDLLTMAISLYWSSSVPYVNSTPQHKSVCFCSAAAIIPFACPVLNRLVLSLLLWRNRSPPACPISSSSSSSFYPPPPPPFSNLNKNGGRSRTKTIVASKKN